MSDSTLQTLVLDPLSSINGLYRDLQAHCVNIMQLKSFYEKADLRKK